MIDNDKFLEIFNPVNNARKLQKERALAHYQEQADAAIEEALIESYKATGQHPCAINVDDLVYELEEELGVKASDNAVNHFKMWLSQEILRVRDYD